MRRTWKITLCVMASIIMIPGVMSSGFPLQKDDPVIIAAIEYMVSHQNPDGGFGQFDESDLSTTSRIVEAIAAVDRDPLSYEVNGVGPDDYFLSVSEAVYKGEYGTNPVTDKVNLILGLVTCGLDPRDFGGHDHVQSLLSMQDRSTYAFGTGTSDTTYALLALLAAGVPQETADLRKARDYVEWMQTDDNTFEHSPGFGADSNTHSIVIVLLKVFPGCHGCFVSSVKTLPSYQNETNRGFYYQSVWGKNSDVTSTALGLQAILAAGESPNEFPYSVGGEDPVKYLLGAQNSTTGEFYDPWGSLRPTSLAVPALLGKWIPGARVPETGIFTIGLLASILLAYGKRCKA